MSFNFISAVAEVKEGMIKTQKIDLFHFLKKLYLAPRLGGIKQEK